jgi:hypothetical protein
VIGKMFQGNLDNEIEELEKESQKRSNSLNRMQSLRSEEGGKINSTNADETM